MIAGAADGAQQAVLGRHTGGEGERLGATLQRGKALLQRGPGRVRGPGVFVTAPQPAHAVLGVGGDLVDRRDHGAGGRVRLLPGPARAVSAGPVPARAGRARAVPAGALPAHALLVHALPAHEVPPARNARRSWGVIIPAGRPSTSTTAAPAFS